MAPDVGFEPTTYFTQVACGELIKGFVVVLGLLGQS